MLFLGSPTQPREQVGSEAWAFLPCTRFLCQVTFALEPRVRSAGTSLELLPRPASSFPDAGSVPWSETLPAEPSSLLFWPFRGIIPQETSCMPVSASTLWGHSLWSWGAFLLSSVFSEDSTFKRLCLEASVPASHLQGPEAYAPFCSPCSR